MRWFIHAKIHRATVTEANPDYIGSIGICPLLLEKTGIKVGEKVLISNINNGHRFETYVIEGKQGEMSLNGAAALLVKPKDLIIVMGFELSFNPRPPSVILVDEQNAFLEYVDAPKPL